MSIFSQSFAADGTWDTDSAGNWTDITKWFGDTAYASDTDATATFGNVITADRTITLDALITIGNITASDTTHNYTISGANTITLDRTTGLPFINVTTAGRTFSINSQIAGTDGLQKNGGGSLVLSNAFNSFSGGITLNGGTLSFGANGHLGAVSNAISVIGNSTLAWTGGATTQARAIDIASGSTLSISGVSNSGYSGALTGSGTLTNAGFSQPYIFSSANNTFTGTVNAAYGMTFASLGDGGTYNFGNSSVGLIWTGGARTFSTRSFNVNGVGNTVIANNGSGALVIGTNLAISGTAGARTLQLGGSYTGGANQFAGNIADGVGSVLSVTKTNNASIWALSGTNTYSGATSVSVVGASAVNGGGITFQGIQALSPNTSLNATSSASNGGNVPGVFRILDDSSGTISRSTVNMNWSGANGQDPFTIFVGNNSSANGGNSAGTTTGSTIQLGNMNFGQTAGSTAGLRLDVTGANDYRLQINNVNVTLQAAHNANLNIQLNATTAPLTVTGTVRQANDAGASSATTLQLNGSAAGNLISGAIRNSAGGRLMNVTKSGTGSWSLSGTNDYTGITTVSGGILDVSTLANGGNSSNIGASSNAAGNLVLNGGTLRYTGAAASTDRLFSLQASSTIDASGTGAVNFTNTGSMGFNGGTAAKTLTLTGTNTGDNTIAAIIGDNTRATAITKTGSGTWVLSGANTFTGATSVLAGKLLIHGSTSASSNFTVNNLATLGGSGTIGGTVTLMSGATLSPGASIESLATGSNTWNGGSTVQVEFSTDGSTGAAGTQWDLLSITGTLDLTGASSSSPIVLDLVSMLNATDPGLLAIWNKDANATWAGFVTTTGGITGFAVDKFAFDTTQFLNTLNGTFSVSQNGNNLDLNYVTNYVIPEPKAALLGSVGLLLLLRRRR